ncbi:MAG TPA: hypothetical protein PLR30_13400 [Saprospiraceae bacterium]|nr:hypothetical protein [Saprospiraceae bacterium]
MMNLRGQFIGALVAIGLAFTWSCTLDEPADTNQDPALTLDYTQHLSLTNLTWDPVRVTGFKEYIILQSSNQIANSPTPVINQDVTVLKRINDVDVTSLTVSTMLFSPQICYKLYCAVDDRFLYSSTLCIQQDIDVVNGFYDRGCHTAGQDEAVVFDRVNSVLSTLNYKTGTITSSVTDGVLSFPSLEMSTWTDVTNVFGFDQSPAWLRKYNFPALTASNSKNFNQILWAANVHNQFVFVATDDFGNNFQVLNSSNLSFLHSIQGMSGNQNIAVFPGDPLAVITIGSSVSKKYSIDTDGKILTSADVPARILQPDLQSTCAEGTDLFICGREGTIINRNGVNVGTLNTDINASILLNRLSIDEKKAIYIITDNGVMRLEIADISQLPLVTLLTTYDLPALSYADLIPEEQIIYVIGTSFISSQAQTTILRYPL